MHKPKIVVFLGAGLAVAVAGCSADPSESSRTSASRLQTGAQVMTDTYVETWENEAVASDRANDMRALGLWVEQEGTLLRIHPAESDVGEMMERAASDQMMAKWGGGEGGGGLYTASKSLGINTSGLKPQGFGIQPLTSEIEGSIAGSVRLRGGVTAKPDISVWPSTCGRGCLRLDGKASLSVEGNLDVDVDGAVKVGRGVYDITPEIPVGNTIILIPTPVPIPVTVTLWFKVEIACEGEVNASLKTSASFGVAGDVSFWASMGTNSAPQAGVSSDFRTEGDFQREGAVNGVSFGCSIPEVKVGARVNFMGGPFVTLGPKLTLRSGAEGGLFGKYTFDTGIGVEATRLGWGSVKVDGPSFVIRPERQFF